MVSPAGGDPPPPSGLGRVGATLQLDLRSPGAARHLVNQACTNWDLTELADVAMLLTSEVVTNAVRHAGTPARVTVSRRPQGVRVEVCDGRPSHRPQPGAGGLDGVGGRGLVLVEALSSRWSVAANGAMKCVWFELDA